MRLVKWGLLVAFCVDGLAWSVSALPQTGSVRFTEFESQVSILMNKRLAVDETLTELEKLEQQYAPLTKQETLHKWFYRCQTADLDNLDLSAADYNRADINADNADQVAAALLCRGSRSDFNLSEEEVIEAFFNAYSLESYLTSARLRYISAYYFSDKVRNMGLFVEGLRAARVMLEIAEANDLLGLKIEAYREQAFLLADLGEVDQALASNQKAIDLAESETEVLSLLMNRGYMLTNAGRDEAALAVFDQIMARADDSNRQYYEINVGANRSFIYARTLQIENNLKLTERLVKVARNYGDEEYIAYANMSRAFALFEAGQYEAAQTLFDQFSPWFVEHGYDVLTAEDYESWANLLFENGQYQKAYTYLKKSVDLNREIDEKQGDTNLKLVEAVLDSKRAEYQLLEARQAMDLAEQQQIAQIRFLLAILIGLILLLSTAIYAYVRLKRLNQALDTANAKLDYESNHDPMTGAYNRRYFYQYLNDLRASTEHKNSFILALLDVDHFKTLNDTYGHDVGDEVLQVLVKRLDNITKKGDKVIRWGGEEFLLYLPIHHHEGEYRQVIDRLLLEINTRPFQIGDNTLAVTISMGFKVMTLCDELENDIKQIDEYLYEAKRSGRSRAIGIGLLNDTTSPPETLKVS